MSGRAMNKILLPALLFFFLLACSGKAQQPPLDTAPLAGAAIGGDFTLIDQDGKQRNYHEFDGKYRIVYFGYTSCPDICTPDMQNLMAGLKQFEKASPELAAKVQPIFITVDPERDKPAILKQFVSAFHPRLLGLTGTEAQIAETAKKFAVYYNRVDGTSPDSYLMAHSQNSYLMGPDGKPLALMPVDDSSTADNEGSPQAVAAELAIWVR